VWWGEGVPLRGEYLECLRRLLGKIPCRALQRGASRKDSCYPLYEDSYFFWEIIFGEPPLKREGLDHTGKTEYNRVLI